jgi:hypothetical protein
MSLMITGEKEGHKIKNPDIKLSHSVRAVPAAHRCALLSRGTEIAKLSESLQIDIERDAHAK